MLLWFCYKRRKAVILSFLILCAEPPSYLKLWMQVALANIFLFIFCTLRLVLIRLDARFSVWLYSPEANSVSKWTDRALTDIICKHIVWDVVLNFELYVSLNWKRVLQLVARDFLNQILFMVVYRNCSFFKNIWIRKSCF